MIASFHVLEYRNRVFSPPKRLVGRVEGLRFWRPLNIGGDFGWFRDHPGRWGLYRRLKPDFRRWAYFGVWEDGPALETFLAQSTVGRSWTEQGAEAWHLWLRPSRVKGPWEGMRILEGSEAKTRSDGPLVVITRLDLSLRGTLAMWGSAAPYVLHHIPSGDALLAGIPLVDRPYQQPVSFTVWRSADAALAFAYRREGHQEAISRVRNSQHNVVDRSSTGRFDPYRCEGTYQGRNPLMQMVSPS
jgi:hypothetical protein